MSPIANMLVQIKNAQAVGAANVTMPFSNLKWAIAKLLAEAGFVSEVGKISKKPQRTELNYINLKLKYGEGRGAISGIKIVSKPSRRLYLGQAQLRPVKNGFGLAVISTTQGVMTNTAAKKAGLGGEILFEIW